MGRGRRVWWKREIKDGRYQTWDKKDNKIVYAALRTDEYE